MAPASSSSTGSWERSEAEKARPHKHMFTDEAHAFICHLRTDSNMAKLWCPDLVDAHGVSMVHGKTGGAEILLALVRKLGGELTKLRKPAPILAPRPTKNHKDAAAFKLTRRGGRPKKETAVADAAADLVKRRGEQRVKSDAVKRRRSRSAPPRMGNKAELKVGNFSARGNAITAAKAAAVVQAHPPPTPLLHQLRPLYLSSSSSPPLSPLLLSLHPLLSLAGSPVLLMAEDLVRVQGVRCSA